MSKHGFEGIINGLFEIYACCVISRLCIQHEEKDSGISYTKKKETSFVNGLPGL